ncbi:MAG: hypothetical protein SWZ49_28905, partial [Cyanobacteriota bacterium]|nr:hypothetical protein [Cyanobacteriota bacterium]
MQNILKNADVVANRVDTGFLETHMAELVRPGDHPKLYRDATAAPAKDGGRRRAGARVEGAD